MSSPFAIFRRHQRLSMVILTGLAMISFVLLGAINDPRDIPTPLVVIFFGCLVGGAAWLAGLNSGKASDWGVSGLLIGVLAAVLIIWSSRESSAVQMNGGNLSRQELNELIRDQMAVGQFAQLAIQKSDPEISPAEFQRRLDEFTLLGGNADERLVVFAEILRREGDRLRIAVSDQAVTDYMQRLTGNKITQEIFTEIRKDLDLTERQILEILRQEIKARTAFNLLAENNRLTPQNYWEYYQKLNLKRSAEITGVSVEDYISAVNDPSEADLEAFFQEFRKTPPNITPEGRFEEGRPGFRQPGRVRVAYLEAVLDEIEATIGEITDEEIQKRFEQSLPKSVPENESDTGIEAGNESLLNGPPLVVPKEDSDSGPATDASSETPPTPDSGTPPTPEPGATPQAESSAAPAGAKSSTDPAQGSPAPQNSEPPATPAEEASASPAQPEAAINFPRDLQYVAFQDENPAPQAVSPTAADPGLPAPAATESDTTQPDEPPAAAAKPADSNQDPEPASPADGTPADEPATGTDVPPEPADDPTILTDARKEEIRNELRREKARDAAAKRIEAAQGFVANLTRDVAFGEEIEEGFISPEEATKKIKDYAKANQLLYEETPFLSFQELRESEDYSIGSALKFQSSSVQGRPSIQDVATILFQSAPTDRFRPSNASNFQTGSEYVFWKLEQKAPYAPNSLNDEPQLKEQVTRAWKMQKALPEATKRAEELAEKIRKSDQPMSETLGEEKTKSGLFLTVSDTGQFTWLTAGFAPMISLEQQVPPRQSIVNGVPNPGDRFFKEVFENLKAGETGVVPNVDNSVVYVVHIKDADTGANDSPEKIRPDFLTRSADFNTRYNYRVLGQMAQQEYFGDLREDLWEKYNVVLSGSDDALDAE